MRHHALHRENRRASTAEEVPCSSQSPKATDVLLKDDRSTEAAHLHDRFAPQLTGIIRQRIHSRLRRRIDPEDIVQSAFRSFFRILAGSDKSDRRGAEHLWNLLYRIALNKLYSQIRFHSAAKRNPTCEVYQQDPINEWDSQLAATVVADELQSVMQDCSAYHQRILELLLSGHSESDIAEEVQCSLRTVYRVIERVTEQLKSRLGD